MITKATEKAACHYCNADIEIHEYEGLEGSWYTSHVCKEQLACTEFVAKQKESPKE